MPVTEPIEEDYGSERDRIKRMLAQAEWLRARGDQDPGVGKTLPSAAAGQPSFYVKPSWTQQLAPLVGQVMGMRKEKEAGEAERAVGQRMQGNYDQWMAQRPRTQTQTTETSEEIPGTEAPGPLPEGTSGPLMKTRMAQETTTKEPTMDERIDWAGKGMKNPLSKSLASAYMEDAIVKQPEREAARAFKADEAEKARVGKHELQQAALAQKMEGLKIMSADKSKGRDAQLEITKIMDATRRQMSANEAANRLAVAEIKAKAAGQKVTPVPPKVIQDLSGSKSVAEGLSDSLITFKPEFAGPEGAINKFSGKYNPWSDKISDEAAAWHNQYEAQVAMIERHEKFGTALSKPELAAWKNATISDWTNPQLVASNLAVRARLATKFYNNLRESYINGGHKLVDNAFDPISESNTPIQGGGAQVPTQLVPNQVRNPAPTRRVTDQPSSLPPGVTRIPGT